MEVVRTGLGDHVEQAAGSAAKFGSEAIGDDLKFLDGFEWDGEVFGFERPEIFAEIVIRCVGAVNYQAAVITLLASKTDAAAQPGNNLR